LLVFSFCGKQLRVMNVGIMKRSIKAVLFDLDGTLVDTEALSDKAILHVFKSRLPEDHTFHKWHAEQYSDDRLPWELKKQILGLRGAEWGPIVRNYAMDKWEVDESMAPSVEELWDQWEKNLNSFCVEVEACPGAPQLVEKFATLGLPMAIATSSRGAAVEKKGANHKEMFRKMSSVVAGDHPEVKKGKPAPDIYIEAARQLGVPPSECLVFEDALSGAKAGKAAGCFVVAVPDPRFTPEEKAAFQEVADCVLDDLWKFDGAQFGLAMTMIN